MKKTIYNPQERDSKKGFVNDNGEWLIQPLYDDVDVFREGVCWIKTGGKWGLINENGETLIEPQYDDAREFNEGCGNVKLNGKWGVVDMKGNFIFKPDLDLIYHYDHEIAIVKSGGRYGFINTGSGCLIAPIYDKVQAFSEGFAGVKLNGLWGFIDEAGKYLVEPKFYVVESFSKGKALAISDGILYEIDSQGNCREVREMSLEECDAVDYGDDNLRAFFEGFIDKSGGYVVKPKFERVDDFKNGLARVWIDGKEGIINTKGAYISEPTYAEYIEEDDDCLDELLKTDSETGFKNSPDFKIIKAEGNDGNLGVADSDGNIVVEPKYSNIIWNAEEEVFTVKLEMRAVSRDQGEELVLDHFDGGKKSDEVFDTRWGILDKDGMTIVEPQYNMHWDNLKFSEGLGAVRIGDKCGYIDKTGAVKIEPVYDIAYNFKNGYAVVYIGGKYGIINRKGDFVVQPIYLSIDEDVQDGYRIVQTASGKWSLMNEDFNLMFEPIKYSIHAIDGDMAIIAGYSGFVNCKTGEIIPPKFHHVRRFHDWLAAVTVSEASLESGDF